MSSPAGVNRAIACSPPVSSKARWAARNRPGRARITERATIGPSGNGSQRATISSMDAFPQIPQEAVATNWRCAIAEPSNAREIRTTIVSSG